MNFTKSVLRVSKGQLQYGKERLVVIIQFRDPLRYEQVLTTSDIQLYLMFRIAEGNVEDREAIH
ncbi:MAG TPA: hypothetical protein VKZ56_09470 [Membranihabitans sp.]|nr:hypothetical protein [Membranihabitans sp.]